MLTYSKRLDSISESVTLKLNALVSELKAKGEKVINLTAGEPDFSPPQAANEAVIQAVHDHQSKYTPVAGYPELRQAVADKTNLQQSEIKVPWVGNNVVISNGGKQALYNTFLSILNDGDEVIIISPFWLTYPEVVKLAGGVPKIIETTLESGYKLSANQLKEAITSKTKAVIINSPSNPTGAMYTKEELKSLGDVILGHSKKDSLWVISDEIYDRIILDDVEFCSFLNANPQLQNQTVTVNGMSKSSAMTGWRVGWTVANLKLTQAIIKVQGQTTSGINSLAQWASIAALKLDETQFKAQVESFKRRRNLVLEILSKSEKIKRFKPQGAFYVFFEIGMDSVEFAEKLLEKKKVAVIPGTAFGNSQAVRISFATDETSLKEGCSRIVEFIEEEVK